MLRQEKLDYARRAAADGMVLLKNDNGTLPISLDSKIALFGTTSYRGFRMGWGSGDMMAQRTVQIFEGLKAAGYSVNAEIEKIALDWVDAHAEEYKGYNREWNKWVYRFNEFDISDDDIANAAKVSDVAVITIGRCSGEADDLKNEEGFHKLHKEELDLIKRVSSVFSKVVLLLNVCGVIDLTPIEALNIDSIVDVSLCGEQLGNSVADIVSGKVNPSGRLSTTWAKKYEDYPTREGIDTLVVPYNEGIYVGYRYFDTFGVEPRYPFGYGLSYTDFAMKSYDPQIEGPIVDFCVEVENTGKVAGREVVQCYISAPDGKMEKAYQELCAYVKTDVIKPGEKEEVVVSFDLTEMACYCEKCAKYVLEPGKYVVRVGNSSRNTKVAFIINVEKLVVCSVVSNRLVPEEGTLNLLSKKDATPYTYDGEAEEIANAQVLELDCDSVEPVICEKYEDNMPKELVAKNDGKLYTLEDVENNICDIEDVVAQFSDEELSYMLNGVIYSGSDANANVGSMSSKVRGAAGEMWTSDKYKIPTNACADGPSGVRLAMFNTPESDDSDIAKEVVSYPSGTCLANSWDRDAAYMLGVCVRDDLEYTDIEGWLAPGVNIHRNPLNGRNFEYMSEDPLLAGNIGAYITIGVQYDEDGEPTGRYVTIKHFACNNIEYERGLSDSRASERALREIYLKPFQITVTTSAPLAVMTAYNKINGEFAATNFDLLNGILRGEWGYDGMVMTDWNNAAVPKRHAIAGNDLIMPGCHRSKILDGLKDGTLPRADAQACAVRILLTILRSNFLIKRRKNK
ncbi:MAG: glycoside hydrolase family 3 protein [Clostridia bacterium]|nr:glycoside hydrolase family 3 protein [Clostridia bacterium]